MDGSEAVSASEPVDCVVLAGGLARRFDGRDKGLILLQGHPLVDWVIRRLEPQVRTLVVSANRNLEEYAAFGHPVMADAIPGHVGPLAGIYTAAQAMSCEWVLTAPCDTPFLPGDLVSRLLAGARQAGVAAVYAAEASQAHYGVILLQRGLAGDIPSFLNEGGRRVQDWLARVEARPVLFDDDPHALLPESVAFTRNTGWVVPEPDTDPVGLKSDLRGVRLHRHRYRFFNINTPEDLALAEQLMTGAPPPG